MELRDRVVEADTLVIGFLDVVGTDSHVTVEIIANGETGREVAVVDVVACSKGY